MIVFVTGGTGFLGSHLIEQLSQTGDSVRALARSSSGDEYLRSLGATPIRGNLDDAESLDRACEGCEAVYHSAARVELHGSEKEFYETNVVGTQRLVEAARRTGVRRFVQVSSGGVYFASASVLASGNLIDESTPVFEPPRWFPYGRAKYHAERTVQVCCSASMEWTIVRLAHLYGPRNRTMKTYLEPALNDSMMRIVGDGRNELALVYIEDAARAIMLAGRCREAAGKILLIGPTEPCTQQDYFNALADGFGVPRPTKHINYHVAFFLGSLGEYVVRSGPRRAWMRRATTAIVGLPERINCDYTRKLLGWEPKISFAEGMKRAFEWYRAEHGNAGSAA
jgi:nucleoside-diphosphate-sugar epimerase